MIYIKLFWNVKKYNIIRTPKTKNNLFNILFISFNYNNIYNTNLVVSSSINLFNELVHLKINKTYFDNLICYKKDISNYFFKKQYKINKKYFSYNTNCSAEFGDEYCKYNKNKTQFKVKQAKKNRVLTDKLIPHTDIIYTRAKLILRDMIYEANIIHIHKNCIIILDKDIIFKPDKIELNTSCDKTYENCKTYNNTANFAGEPLLFFTFNYETTFMQKFVLFMNKIHEYQEEFHSNIKFLHPTLKLYFFLKKI